jgi:hypothetical protein
VLRPVRSANGLLNVFVLGGQQGLFQTYQISNQAAPGQGWSSYYLLVGGSSGRFGTTSVDFNGQMELFAQTTADWSVYHHWELGPNGFWAQ